VPKKAEIQKNLYGKLKNCLKSYSQSFCGPYSIKLVLKIMLNVGVRNLEHLNIHINIFVKTLYFSRIYSVGEGVDEFSSTLDIFFMAILYLDLCLRGRGGICYCRWHICNTRIFPSFAQAAVE
jgi:hypothetical protein